MPVRSPVIRTPGTAVVPSSRDLGQLLDRPGGPRVEPARVAAEKGEHAAPLRILARRSYAPGRARAAGHPRLPRGARAPRRRPAARGASAWAARSCCARSRRRSRRPRAGAWSRCGGSASGSSSSSRASFPGAPPDGRGPAALEEARREGRRPRGARGVRLRGRLARPHRGEHEEARVAPPRARASRRSRRSTAAASRSSMRTSPAFREALDAREPHPEARADRSAPLLGHRQRLLRRDPAPGPALAGAAHEPAHRRRRSSGSTRATRDDARASGPSGSIGEAADGVSREGHRVSRGDGRARTLRQAVPGLRHAGAADRLRRERVELLPDLPDRRQAPRRPRALAAAARATGRRRSRSSRSASEVPTEAAPFSRRLRGLGLVAAARGRRRRRRPPSRERAVVRPARRASASPCSVNHGRSEEQMPPRRSRRRRSGSARASSTSSRGTSRSSSRPAATWSGLVPASAAGISSAHGRRRRCPTSALGAGFGWTDLTQLVEIDRRFNFLLQGGVGVRGPLARRQGLDRSKRGWSHYLERRTPFCRTSASTRSCFWAAGASR